MRNASVLDRAIEAAQIAVADDDENGCGIDQHPSGAYTCLDHGVSADNDRMCWFVRDIPAIVLDTSLPILEENTPENISRLSATPIGQALMALAWEEGVANGWTAHINGVDPVNPFGVDYA